MSDFDKKTKEKPNNLTNAIQALKTPPKKKIPDFAYAPFNNDTTSYEIMKNIGHDLKKERLRQGLTQQDVGMLAHRCPQTISSVEKGWGGCYSMIRVAIALKKELTLK